MTAVRQTCGRISRRWHVLACRAPRRSSGGRRVMRPVPMGLAPEPVVSHADKGSHFRGRRTRSVEGAGQGPGCRDEPQGTSRSAGCRCLRASPRSRWPHALLGGRGSVSPRPGTRPCACVRPPVHDRCDGSVTMKDGAYMRPPGGQGKGGLGDRSGRIRAEDAIGESTHRQALPDES